MTEPAPALTPAEHRALAETDLRRVRGMAAGTPAYSALALSAIAHTLAAVAYYLDPDDVAVPEVRLPGGRVVRAEQAEGGSRWWRYVITATDSRTVQFTSRYMFSRPEHARTAGTEMALAELARNRVNGNGQAAVAEPAGQAPAAQ